MCTNYKMSDFSCIEYNVLGIGTNEGMISRRAFLVLFIAFHIGQRVESALTLTQMNQAMFGLRAACQPRFNLSDDEIDEIKQGNFPDEANLKCYVNCVLELMNLVRRGTLNYNAAVKQIKFFMPDGMKELYLDAVDQCRDSANGITDNCEFSFVMLQCFYKTSPVFMFP